MEKFVKAFEEEGFTLDDLTGHLGVFFAGDDSFHSEEMMVEARNDAFDFLYRIYKIALKCSSN